MKKSTFTLALLLFAAFQTVFSANINIAISGFAYSPSTATANIGDVVTIAANANHPLVQVDQTNWNANSPTPVNGWTNQTTAYTFTVTTAGTFYYGCANHMASMQMKGMITMNATGITQATVAAYNLGIFPNPVTSTEFTVKAESYSGNGKVMIYNTEGKLMETHALTGVSTVVKSGLTSGAYFYEVIINDKQVYRSKFLMTLSK